MDWRTDLVGKVEEESVLECELPGSLRGVLLLHLLRDRRPHLIVRQHLAPRALLTLNYR